MSIHQNSDIDVALNIMIILNRRFWKNAINFGFTVDGNPSGSVLGAKCITAHPPRQSNFEGYVPALSVVNICRVVKSIDSRAGKNRF